MTQAAKLLVVDGDESNRDCLTRRLVRFEVASASTGAQALEMAAVRPFDAVLVDLHLPDVAGLYVLERLRERYSAADLPILVMTGEHDRAATVNALRLGANDYLTKPLDLPEAEARIENSLALAHSGLPLTSEMYRRAAGFADDGLWDWNFDTREIHYSPRWKAMLGFAEDEIANRTEDWFGRIHPEDSDRVWEQIRSVLENGWNTIQCEYRILHKDGRYRWMETRGGPARDERGKPVRLSGSQTDITVRRTIDFDTSLPNLNWIEEELRVALTEVLPAALLVLELDGFERVAYNLADGRTGRLLKSVAQRLNDLLGSMPEAAMTALARADKHEFAILLRGADCLGTAQHIAMRLLKAFLQPFLLEQQIVYVTASIGIAVSSPGGRDQDLVSEARAALRHARGQGQAGSDVFDKSMVDQEMEELRLETDLRAAIERHEFVVHYQPIVDLETGRIGCLEALVRWRRPGFGLVMPGDFIPLAERTGLVTAMGEWVLVQACADMAELRRVYPSLAVSVNVSGRQFSSRRLLAVVCEALERAGLAPGALRLEVTETVVMSDPNCSSALLEAFRQLGVGLKLDDFGSGYSSLSYLERFPFQTIKIDRSFVARLGASVESAAIVQSILQLAQSLGRDVVAEGIETAEQAELLRQLGCGYGQGFWYSKAVELPRVYELLAAGCLPLRQPARKSVPAARELVV
ncbi:MAG: EAL domain-containing protein [Bryobacteraceae bacterium]|jgi:PAS domain S-box-containing protein